MGLFSVTSGATGSASLWNQLIDLLTGKNDAPVNTFAQIAAPGAPTVAVNTTSGNLSGNYQYKIAFVTGYWEGAVGTGAFHAQGNTSGGTASATVSPSSEQVDLTAIPTGGTGVYERIIYRTQSGGTSFYYLDTIADNTTTTYTDNATDANLGSAMPTTNTTGSNFTVGKDLTVNGKISGDGSGLTNLPITEATTSTLGTVEISDAPSGSNPIAVTTDNAAYKAVNGGTYISAGTGIQTTAGTDSETVSLDTGTTALTNYLRTDTNAPSSQTVANEVEFAQGWIVPDAQTIYIGSGSGNAQANAAKIGNSIGTGDTVLNTHAGINVQGISPEVFGVYEENTATQKFAIDKNGDAGIEGDLTTASGQLGSASGTWVPASGTFNVASGTLINIAKIPTGANLFYAYDTINAWLTQGFMTSAGAGWEYSGSTSAASTHGWAGGVSSTTITGNPSVITDGSYQAQGYFQLSGGYLQFVVTSSSNIAGNTTSLRWAVS